MNRNKVFQINCIGVTMEIPEWFPQDRFDYQHANKFTCNVIYGNRAEDQLFKAFPDCKEICKGAWITFEFNGACSGDHLHHWIVAKRHKLHKFFKRYKEWTPEWESKWSNTVQIDPSITR